MLSDLTMCRDRLRSMLRLMSGAAESTYDVIVTGAVMAGRNADSDPPISNDRGRTR